MYRYEVFTLGSYPFSFGMAAASRSLGMGFDPFSANSRIAVLGPSNHAQPREGFGETQETRWVQFCLKTQPATQQETRNSLGNVDWECSTSDADDNQIYTYIYIYIYT